MKLDVNEVRVALRSPDAEVRRRAVLSLEGTPSDDSTKLIAMALGDDNWRVRKEAARVAVLAASSPTMISELLDAIAQGDNVGLRNAALEAFAMLGTPATGPLLELLPRAPLAARKFVIEALGTTGDVAVVPELERASQGDDANIAAAAIDALARIGGNAAELALRKQLTSDNPFQQMAALNGLDRLQARVAWPELSPLLGQRFVRRAALGVLGRSGNPNAVTPLVEALTDRSEHVVALAASGLMQLHVHAPESLQIAVEQLSGRSREELRGLHEMCSGSDLAAKRAAAHVLVLARDPDVLPHVLDLAIDDQIPDPTLRALREWGTVAVRRLLLEQQRSTETRRAVALELVADLGFGLVAHDKAVPDSILSEIRSAFREASTSRDEAVAVAGLRALGPWGEPSDAELLVRVAEAGDERTARECGAALEALATRHPEAVERAIRSVALDGPGGPALAGLVAKFGGPEAHGRLQAALSADSPVSRRAAVEALASIGGARVAELIALALADEDLDVQVGAAAALGKLEDAPGKRVAANALLLALRADIPNIRATAARSLGRLGDGRAIEPLRELVRTESSFVVVAAIESLRALRDPIIGDVLVEALGHNDHEVVKQALSAIHEASGERASARVALALEHPAWDVRRVAAQLLGKTPGKRSRDALVNRLARETDDFVCAAIQRALRDIDEAG